MHLRIERANSENPITSSDWNEAVTNFSNFFITNTLIQQNPFTKELIEAELEGCGYWMPSSNDAPEWPGDGKVVFRKDEQGVTFIQYQNCENTELAELASLLGAKLVEHTIL